jgi:hypothetical protein
MINCLCGCGIELESINKRGDPSRFVKGHNLIGLNHQKRKPGNRYKSVNIQGKIIREHRKIIEDKLKACLLPWTSIHHKNGIKKDNRIENLEVMTKSKHTKLHLPRLGTGKRKFDLIECACGCGNKRLNYYEHTDSREKRYINGHNRRKVI